MLYTVVQMYVPHDETPIFRLPQDPEEKQRWSKALPSRGRTVICEHHWKVESKVKNVPASSQPTVFESIPPNVIPTPQPKPRTNTRVLSP